MHRDHVEPHGFDQSSVADYCGGRAAVVPLVSSAESAEAPARIPPRLESRGFLRRRVKRVAWDIAKGFLALLGVCTALCGSVSCIRSLDMSGEQLTRPETEGTEWGVVIGSVLVQPEKGASDKDVAGREVMGEYEFDIVQIQPGDPYGDTPYAERYRLDAKAGEERIFISRLRTGQYLFKNFHEARVRGIGGDLNLTFASMAGEVRYIGRILVEIPQRITVGKGYRFTVQNAREPTLAQVSEQHADLTKEAVNVPMRASGDVAP
jgi:hypothetical protein